MILFRPAAANETLTAAIKEFRNSVAISIDHILTIERFISLHVPQMEDGNNFGVTVQLTISKFLTETREELTKKLEAIPTYYASRAEAVSKLSIPKTTASKTITSTSSESTGGKDGDEKKSSTTQVEEKKTIDPDTSGVDHRLKHVVALDVQFYNSLRIGLVDCMNSYLTVLDNMEKNKNKLTAPKGFNGGNSMGMY